MHYLPFVMHAYFCSDSQGTAFSVFLFKITQFPLVVARVLLAVKIYKIKKIIMDIV